MQNASRRRVVGEEDGASKSATFNCCVLHSGIYSDKTVVASWSR